MESKVLILAVDDEPDNFDVLEILLLREGHQLKYAANSMAALDFLNTAQPDVILLDVMMPDINGIELCRQIKASPQWQHIPIVMVTALNSKEDLARCIEAGADDFVGKPVNGVELRARVRSMLRIKQQYDALDQLMSFREEMCDMLVHDLRNPLAVILTACQILQIRQVPEQYQGKVTQIEQAGRELQHLIDDILIMAKIRAGKLEVNRTEIDLALLGQSTIENCRELATQHRIELVAQLPPPGRTLALDATLIRRILNNLLSNAIKFSAKNTQVALDISYPTDTQVKMQVIDQGVGMSEALQSQIFRKYETGRNISGVSQIGLGLAFCKLAIEAHGGQISVQSQEMQGSVFTVEIDTRLVVEVNQGRDDSSVVEMAT